MKFIDWLYSSYPNPHIDGQWGLLHIITLLLCIGIIVSATIFLKNKSEKAKRTFIWILTGLIILFEVARRIINLCKTTDYGINNILRILLPRPGCAISCWLVIIATIANKKFLYNFASIIGIICAVIFFAYPGVGFNNQFILFENLYSIATHSLFLVSCICFITLKFTDFKYKNCWKELVCLGVLAVYVFLEIVLKIEGDPFYFMPRNDILEIVGLPYGVFLTIYIGFIALYFNSFYLINDRKNVFKNKKRKEIA